MKIRVMIDAGHDGKRNQSPVLKSYYESDFAWKVSNYLGEELTNVYGIEVGYTRKSQNEVKDVVARGTCAKGYDLLISEHSNAVNDPTVDRVSAIYLANDDTTGIDEVSKEVAEIMVRAVSDTMGIKSAPKAYYKLAGYDRNDNGITTDDDYYGILYGAHKVGTAALIIENGFHTNLKDARWLSDDANVRKLAKAQAKVIANYFGITAKNAPKDDEPTFIPDNKAETVAYKVVKGDTLAKIASKYGTTVNEIMALNPIIRKANVISVGWVLTIPVGTSVHLTKRIKTYTVKNGDSLSKIAATLTKAGTKVTWLQIANANGIKIPYVVRKGQVLIIP